MNILSASLCYQTNLKKKKTQKNHTNKQNIEGFVIKSSKWQIFYSEHPWKMYVKIEAETQCDSGFMVNGKLLTEY